MIEYLRILLLATPVFLFSPTVAMAEKSCSEAHEHPMQSAATPVFCPVKSPGQLCTHGTADLLKLEGPARERWIAAVRQHNAQVKKAQKQILEEARGFLTPTQMKEAESFFAKQGK